MTIQTQHPEAGNAWRMGLVAFVGALFLLVLTFMVLGAASLPVTWDEKYILPVIETIFNSNWSMHSLIDYDDTKGPAFFWLYAAFGEVFGHDLATLRWLSMISTALWVAMLVGMLHPGERRPGSIAAVTLLALTLPYALVMSQLIMSEPSFLVGCAVMALAAVQALSSEHARTRFVSGPILFGILFALLLHHRVHVVAPAAAIVVLALERDRWKSWPWFAAGLAAGLSRLPLYVRWGGLVGESFQHRYAVGFRADSLVYLSAALLPTIGLVLVVAVLRRRELGHRVLGLILIAGGLAAGLASIAPPAISSDPQALNFAGPVASVLRPLSDSPVLFHGVLSALCAAGVMSLAALLVLTWKQTATAPPVTRLGSRLAGLTIFFGWLLSAAASGDVYDRYLIASTFLWPMLCLRLYPRPLLILQVFGQLALTGQQLLRLVQTS